MLAHCAAAQLDSPLLGMSAGVRGGGFRHTGTGRTGHHPVDMLLLLRPPPPLPPQVAVKELREENERLRRDNERFVRLIDSGEWGRGRVSELVSAGACTHARPLASTRVGGEGCAPPAWACDMGKCC